MSVDHLQNQDRSNDNPHMVDHTMTRAMALNLAAWTESSVRCFGIRTFRTGSLWWRDPGGSPIYLGAVICHGGTAGRQLLSDLSRVRAAWGTEGFHVYDCWANRDLGPAGFVRQWQTPWYLRPSSAIPASPPPDGLSIEVVAGAPQLAEFERASWIGFEEPEGDLPEREPFSQHPLATLEDPGMYYLNARLDGQVVAGTIAHVTADMVGIYGISTLPQFRRRGYATALVRAAVALRPDLPVSVYPDPPSVPIYTGIGFLPAGEIAVWKTA